MPAPTRLIVLGAGRVGSAIAADLAADPAFRVTVADLDARRAEAFPSDSAVRFRQVDLAAPGRVQELVAPFDLVIGAVPGCEGLYLATGHAFKGVTLALTTGRNLAQLMMGGRPDFSLDEFSPSRLKAQG